MKIEVLFFDIGKLNTIICYRRDLHSIMSQLHFNTHKPKTINNIADIYLPIKPNDW